MPLVALLICEEVSDGINADSVELRKPCVLIVWRKDSSRNAVVRSRTHRRLF